MCGQPNQYYRHLKSVYIIDARISKMCRNLKFEKSAGKKSKSSGL